MDTEGAHAFDTFRKMSIRANERQGLTARKWDVVKYTINGLLLERWFLKTLINLSFGGEYPIGDSQIGNGLPTKALVEIAFGIKRFAAGDGLYSVVNVGQQVQSFDTLRFSPLIKDKAYIVGGLFEFRGFRYLLSFDPNGPPQQLTGIGLPGEDWGVSQLNYHNVKIKENQGGFVSQIIRIRW